MSISDNSVEINLLTRNIISTISSSASIIGSLFIIISYFKFKNLRGPPYILTLVVYLALSDLLGAISGIWIPLDVSLPTDLNNTDDYENLSTNYCRYMGFITQFANLSSLNWTGAFAWTLYQFIVLKKLDTVNKMENYYVIIGFGVPMIWALALWFFYSPEGAAFGYNPPACWIEFSSGNHDTLFLFVGYYMPLIIVFVFNLVCYIGIIAVLVRDGVNFGWTLQFLVYPLILFLCTIFAWLDRWLQQVGHENNLTSYLHVFFFQLQGFLNFIVYGYNENVRKYTIPYIKRVFCCKTENKEEVLEEKIRENLFKLKVSNELSDIESSPKT